MLVASLFVVARWEVAAHRDVSRFVVAGSDYAAPSSEVAVTDGHGYDGQFAYRLAVAPGQLTGRADGVVLDSPLRLQRMTYPMAAHLVALGDAEDVPWALVLVNIVGIGLLALWAAVLARDAGRPPVTGLLVVGFFGFLTSLGRDLTEIATAALLVGGVLAWQRHRPG